MYQSVLDAFMISFHFFSQAASTSVAMPGLVAVAHPAYVALVAVEYALLNGFVVIEATGVAVVVCEILLAVDARLSFRLLLSAKETFHHCDFEPVKLMT